MSREITVKFAEKYILPFVYHNPKRKYIRTKRFSPVIYENDLPHEADLFHYNPEEVPYRSKKDRAAFIRDHNIIVDDLWWEKQYDRCINGYIVKNATNLGEDVWIPGRMYFFLNFWPIKREKDGRKTLGNPRFIDMGFEKFYIIRELMALIGKDNMWMKRRQGGFTEMGANDIGWEATFMKDSQSVVVAGEDKYTFNFMNFIVRGLKYLSNTQFHMHPSVYRPKSYIKFESRGSEIYGRTALNNAEAVSSLSPSLIYFEETGIWQPGILQKAYDHVKESLVATEIKTGFACFIGTGGDMEKGVATVQGMFYKPEANGLLAFDNVYGMKQEAKIACFVSSIYFKIIDEDGNSDTELARKKILEERKTRTLAGRYTFITQQPLTPKDAFLTNTAGYFGEAIVQALNERAAYILGNPSKIFHQKGYLAWRNSANWFEGVEFVESEKESWCNIFEHPRTDITGGVIANIYKAATDSYDQDEANTSTSEGSIQIFKTFNNINDPTFNKYVARITDRPTTGEGGVTRFYEWSLMLCIYYNAVNLIEHSKILIIDFYIINRFEFLLKEKPEFFLSTYVGDSKTSNTYGVDTSTKPVWLKKMRDYLSPDNIAKMDDLRQIQALAMFTYKPGSKYNCDITISSSLCQVAAYNDQDIDFGEEETEDLDYGAYEIIGNGIAQA